MDQKNEEAGPSIEEQIGDALRTIFKDHNDAIVNKFVVIVETIQTEERTIGERGVWTFTSPGAMTWEIKGMIADAADFQSAHSIAQILEDHGHG